MSISYARVLMCGVITAKRLPLGPLEGIQNFRWSCKGLLHTEYSVQDGLSGGQLDGKFPWSCARLNTLYSDRAPSA